MMKIKKMTAMRRNYFITSLQLLAVVLTLSLAGCSKEEKAATSPQEQVVPKTPASNSNTLVAATPIPNQHPGSVKHIKAGLSNGPQTLTSLQLGETSAKVLWNAGDSFETYYIYNNSFYYDVFTTSQNGVEKADFTAKWGLDPSDAPFYHLYPKTNRLGTYSSELVLGINIPAEQTAVVGGVQSGLLFAFAYGATSDQNLSFYNIPALIKFRISGGVSSQVKSVKFDASVQVSGDVVLHNNNGKGEILNGVHFGSDVTSNYINLSGTFAAGNDYFMVAVPATLTGGFTMTFSNEGGSKSTTKSYGVTTSPTKAAAASDITLTRSVVLDLGTISLGDEFQDDNSDLNPIKYCEHTAGNGQAVFAVLAEGYQRSELDKFKTDAQNALNALFNVEPYKSYKQYLDVWILPVASNESGANITDGNNNIITPRDCYFKSQWGESSYGDMKSNPDIIHNFLTQKCPPVVSGDLTSWDVPVALIINDTRYGGMCWSYNNGWAYAMVPTSYNGAEIGWNYPNIVPVSMVDASEGYRSVTASEKTALGCPNKGNWTNTFCHEFGGHAFGRLGDEYWYDANTATTDLTSVHSWTVPFKMNVSDSYTTVPWQVLLDNKTALVAADAHYSRIGKFQAGDVYMFGRWRSEEISAMIDNRFYFSAWQRYLIAQKIMKFAGLEATFNYDFWKARDVTNDPNRDGGSSTPTLSSSPGEIHWVYPCPPPREVVVE